MKHATPKMWDLAENLIALETARESSPMEIAGALQVWGRLRPPLASLMGNIGVRALLSRALTLATAEVPSLRALHVNGDGSFKELEEPGALVGADKTAMGAVVLVAQLLGLLVTFIGEDLTLRLVREIWPKVRFDESDLGKGRKNAEPK